MMSNFFKLYREKFCYNIWRVNFVEIFINYSYHIHCLGMKTFSEDDDNDYNIRVLATFFKSLTVYTIKPTIHTIGSDFLV